MDKTVGSAQRRQLLAAVSVLGVSLGMADVAHAATQSNHKDLKPASQHSAKTQTGQHSLKLEGQHSYKAQASHKQQNSYKPHGLGGQVSTKVNQE